MTQRASMPEPTAAADSFANIRRTQVRRHLLLGWLGLLVFLTMGIALEMLHGFKVEFYLDTRNQTRRLMWTLAHAHGTLFAIVNIAYAATLGLFESESSIRPSRWASGCLAGALVLLPSGFFLGGLWIEAGDPGEGILLVPAGAALLLIGVASVIWLVITGRHGGHKRGDVAAASAETRPRQSKSRRR